MKVQIGVRAVLAAIGVLALAGVSAAPAVAQQTGSIRGTIVDATTLRPLAGAQVFIPSTQGAVAGGMLGTLADAQGRFLIVNVPAGQHTVRAELIGYTAEERTVEVIAGQSATVNFRLQETALRLEEVVVTGVAGATPRAKLPFDVSKLQATELIVPAVTPGGALQGKVAGVRVVQGTGQPGQGPSVMLRGATSINNAGRSQEPLYIVDGVILGSRPADLDALDIESIEIVKGAAAASLYGSRAANGVVQIQTKRGAQQEQTTRYTARMEYGASSLPTAIQLNRSHAFRMDPAQTTFVDTLGNPVDYAKAIPETSNTSRLFHDNPYPGQTFDQIRRFFDPGNFLQNYVAAEGRSGNTNYYASFSNLDETGIVRFNKGYNRQNFRLNLDHGLRDDLQMSLSTFYSNSWQDLLDAGGGAGAFFNLTFVKPNIDLLEIDPETGELRVNPDPRSLEDNPLYEIRYRDQTRERRRFMGSGLIRYSPVTWFDLEGNVSYDRADQLTNVFYPKGYARGSIDPTPLTKGSITRYTDDDEALNASATASFYWTFGNLTTRTKARYLYESAREEGFLSEGNQLVAAGVTSLRAAAGDKQVGSFQRDIRSEGYFFITSLDYDGKYILDALLRRDGSSLFGADERWQTYYRASGAWRLSQEPWFTVPGVEEFKLRASYGTAGGRPRFEAQYETFDVVLGRLVPNTLGNRQLKPEFAREIEVGLDASLFNRITLGLTYADTRTEDQILLIPLPASAGFKSQWRNAGTLESKTWEASLEASLVETRDLRWWSKILFDRSTNMITELNIPPYQAGSSSAFIIREGVPLGTFLGHRFATSCADLPQNAQQFCNLFQVNDDGYLVFVGQGNTLRSGPGPDGKVGTADDLWGTQCPAEVRQFVINSVGGCEFGLPFWTQCTDQNGDPTLDCTIGNTIPDFNLSFSNNIDWRGFSLYALFDGSFGFNIYNQTIQWAYREEAAGVVDQRGEPEELKKPVKYYLDLYDINNVNSHFVEDGSFVKLRELALRYSLTGDRLRALRIPRTDRVTLALIGRNLATWTKYTGYDPEVGNPFSTLGSAAIDRFDGYQYPNFRTLTASVQISF